MPFPRRSGILLHPTSLPSPFGIGDLGRSARRFIDFLSAAGQSYWQILPLGPTGYGNSPYQGLSAFAGNPILIDLRQLVRLGHLTEDDLAHHPDFPEAEVDFEAVLAYKSELLDRAYQGFRATAPEGQHVAFRAFCADHGNWLEDFALFMALRQAHDAGSWQAWEPELAARDPAALSQARGRLHHEIEKEKYWQWQFFQQWMDVKAYANRKGIAIIGDIPIFVALDSADVWANSHLFELDEDLQPKVVSGVPPDFFSETGQLWGHPLYRWDLMAENDYAWWTSRFRMAFTQADVIRIDHFRGFYNYWEVPGDADTAAEGTWCYGPAADLFEAVTRGLGEVDIIAEDLGDFDAESRAAVDALEEQFDYPGMKVLQFAFGGDPADPFLPHNYGPECVVYTGTHDNDTVVGWYEETSRQGERAYALRYLDSDGSDIAWDLIRLAWSSVANTAMTTAQDLLSLGNGARMNLPGTVGPHNWTWRLQEDDLTLAIAHKLREMTETYGRRG
jgi:4-alpha-glucanotransferase